MHYSHPDEHTEQNTSRLFYLFLFPSYFWVIRAYKYDWQKCKSNCLWRVECVVVSYEYFSNPLKEHCPTEITKLSLLNCHNISPNATKYITKLDKKILQRKTEAVFWRKRLRITRMEVDYSSSIFISWQAVKKSKFPILVKFCGEFFSRYFVLSCCVGPVPLEANRWRLMFHPGWRGLR